jgi:hypothetical protein
MTELSPQLLEKFILSDNKLDVLKEITPHTTLYSFLELFILTNTPGQNITSLQEKFTNFKSQNPSTENLQLIELQLLFKRAAEAKEDPKKLKEVVKELNDKYLFQSFVYTNSNQQEYRDNLESSESCPPSALTADELKSLSLDARLEKVVKDRQLCDLSPEFYNRLNYADFDLKKEFTIVENIIFAHNDLSKLKGINKLIADIAAFKGYSYVQQSLWHRLPLHLKEELLDPTSTLFYSKEIYMSFLDEKFNLEQLNKPRTSAADKIKNTLTCP